MRPLLLISILVVAPGVSAQGDLIEAGRFEEAVASLSGLSPAEYEDVAEAIFQRAYSFGFQTGDFEYAVRGMAAAKQIPDITDAMFEKLSFWHGFSLYNQARLDQEPETLETAEAALPKFRDSAGQIGRS